MQSIQTMTQQGDQFCVFSTRFPDKLSLLKSELHMFKTNEYFDGKVKSIAFQSETLPASVGVMAKGEYVFSTGVKEKMTVISGALTI